MFNRDADTDKRLGDWVDSQYVLNTLQISERTLQTFRDNGTLAYSQIGHKMFYKPKDVEATFRTVDDYKKMPTGVSAVRKASKLSVQFKECSYYE